MNGEPNGHFVGTVRKEMESHLTDEESSTLASMKTTGAPYLVFGADRLARPERPVVPALAEARLFAVVAMLGARHLAYESENSGLPIRHVQPKHPNQVGSHGRVDLPLHTDMGYLRFPGEADHPELAAAPDFLILSCISNPCHVGTRIVTLDEVQALLPRNHFKSLMKKEFQFESPDSVAPPRVSEPFPVIFDHVRYGLMMRWEKCAGLTQEAKRAVSALTTLFDDPSLGRTVSLAPHETLVFNNRTIVHGRGPIPVTGAGTGDRHLVRLYAQRLSTEVCLANEQNPHLQKG